MGIIVNNIKPIRIMFNCVEATLYHNGIKIWPEEGPDPYNPLNLPPNTVRVRTNDGLVPSKDSAYVPASYETATLVEGTSDVYDVYKSGTDFSALFYGSENVVEVLGANTTGITNMGDMFSDCYSLTTVSLFDTSSVTNMSYMFGNCNSLITVPLFDTSSATSMYYMFYDCDSLTTVPLFDTSSVENVSGMLAACINVEAGALALYRQASNQTKPPYRHTDTFKNCGSNTTTGAAELAQIPSDWGGTAA